LEFYGNAQGQSEHDFQVSAGADPSQIRMKFQGAENLAVDSRGALQITTAHGALTEQAPFIYQLVNGVCQQVQGGYVLLGPDEVGFRLGQYNRQAALVIDPVVTVNGFNNNTPVTLHFNFDGHNETISTLLTQFNATVTGDSGASVNIETFCAYLFGTVSGGQSYGVTPRTDLASAFVNGPRIAWIYQTVGQVDLTNDPDEAAAAQAAIWECLPDHAADHFSQDTAGGTFSAGDPDVMNFDLSGIAAQDRDKIVAETDRLLKASLGMTTAGSWLDRSVSGQGQDLLLPLTASGVDVHAVEGQAFGPVTVANFMYGNPDAPAGSFTATVNWGDGSPLDANTSIASTGNGTFRVTGNSHTYTEEGQYKATVTITQNNGATATTTSTATVDDAPLTALPAPSLFAPQNTYSAGNTPDSIAPITLDNGQTDLLVANFFGNNVTLLSNNGDGTFQNAATLPTGGGPNGFAVGDFGNGHQDFAIANYFDNTVTIYMGDGQGNFTAGPTLSTGSGPANEMAIADFNGDGNLDLATANWGDGTVSVFMGNGDGAFQSAQTYNVGGAIAVTAGDFTGTGRQDLAVADFNNSRVTILANNGDGSFTVGTPIAVGANPWYITAADLNNDGKADLATANFYGAVSVLLSNGGGSFQNPVEYAAGANPTGVMAGDINGNGKIDLVVGNYGSNNVSVLQGNGDGTFQRPQNFGAGSGPNELTVGNFTSDGKLDIAVANQNSNDASVLLNQSIQPVAGQAFTGVVATFTDANPFAAAADFTAVIRWGDANSSTVPGADGAIVGNADGSFSVNAGHTYTQSGTYTVQTVISDDGGSTSSTSMTVYVADPAHPVNAAEIGGLVWLDGNENGTRDPGENGLSEVTVNLLDPKQFVLDSTVTDATGHYQFSVDRALGNEFQIQVEFPPGYEATIPFAGPVDRESTIDINGLSNVFNLPAYGQALNHIDAGLVTGASPLGSLTGRAWLDGDGNGIRETNEPGLADITVNLFSDAGMLVDTSSTDDAGNYSFTGLTPGRAYTVQFVAPNGYSFAPEHVGAPDMDSDADANGFTDPIVLAPSENDENIDAGLVGVAPILVKTPIYMFARNHAYRDIAFAASAYDPHGYSLTPVIVQAPAHGSLVFNSSTGLYDYLGDTSFTGVDTFQYRLTNGFGVSDVVTASLLDYDGIIQPKIFDSFPTMVTQVFVGNNGRPNQAAVRQGQIKDCWFVAAAAGVAQQQPNRIPGLIVDNNNGTYTVTFSNFKAVTIGFAGDVNNYSSANGDWLKILEKAYGQAVWNDKVATWGNTPYDYINRGSPPEAAIKALTGNSTTDHTFSWTFDSTTRTKLTNAFANGKTVVAVTNSAGGTKQNNKKTSIDGIVRNHAFTVVAFDAQNDRVRLRNPWGNNPMYNVNGQQTYRGADTEAANDGYFWMSLTDFTKKFDWISYQD
jgi:hypothetical protein